MVGRLKACLSAFLALLVCSSALAEETRSRCGPIFPSDGLLEWDCVRIRRGEGLENLFGEKWVDVARFNRIDRRHAYAGRHIKVPRDLGLIRGFTPMPRLYPPAENDDKFILIDASEQFLGAYEFGRLVLSMPVATGERGNETPRGEFRITAHSLRHRSSKYFIESTRTPYPMNYGLRFYINREGTAYWIHGRDMPGHPASHGCVGLYDEEMQKMYYGYPRDPVLDDARVLYEWVLGGRLDDGRLRTIRGPRVLITGKLP